MPKKEDQLQILLEEMRDNFKLAFEGFSVLGRKIETVESSLGERITSLDNKVVSLDKKIDAIDKKYDLTTRILSDQIKDLGSQMRDMGKTIDGIDQKLTEHMRQPSHA